MTARSAIEIVERTMPGYAARPDGTVVANVFYYLELRAAATG